MSFFPKINKIYPDFPDKLLLSNTVYILTSPTTSTTSNRIYIDFVNLRRIINNVDINNIVDHFIELIVEILKESETVEIHMNLKSFTISTMEKYKDLVLMFYNKYKSDYITRINAVYIYYTPHVFEAIKTIFVKLCPLSNSFGVVPILYSNKESTIKLNELLQNDK